MGAAGLAAGGGPADAVRVGVLYAAVEPATGFSSALLAPNVNTGTMNAFLGVLASELDPGDYVVLIMDQAGWHKAWALKVPDAIVILYLPPYSPELNPVENLWGYMRSHYQQPGLRRLRPPASRHRRRLPRPHTRGPQVRLPM